MVSRIYFGQVDTGAVTAANISATQLLVLGQTATLSAPATINATQLLVLDQTAVLDAEAAAATINAQQVLILGQTATLQSVAAAANITTGQVLELLQTATLSASINLTATQSLVLGQTATLRLTVTGIDTFSDETGTFPTGWTQRFISDATTTITGQAAAPGVAQIVGTTAGKRRALSFDEVPTDGDIEAMVSASTAVIGTSQTLMGVFICGASPGLNANRETMYLAGFTVTAGGVVQYILKKYVDNGTTSTITDIAGPTTVAGFTFAINTLYRIRIRKVGSSIMMRAWPASGAEPGTWDLSGTDGSPLAGGWSGCFYFPANTGKFDIYSYATNTGTAPEPGATATITANQPIVLGQTTALSVLVTINASQPLVLGQSAALSVTATINATQPLLLGQTASITTQVGTANITANQVLVLGQTAVLDAEAPAATINATQPLVLGQSAALQSQAAAANISVTQLIALGQAATLAAPANLTATQSLVLTQSANLTQTAFRTITANQPIVLGQTTALSVTNRITAMQQIVLGQTARLIPGSQITALQPIVLNQIATILAVGRQITALQPIVLGQTAILARVALNGPPIDLTGSIDNEDLLTGSLVPETLFGSRQADVELEGSI